MKALVAGHRHDGPALVVNTYLEGSRSEIHNWTWNSQAAHHDN